MWGWWKAQAILMVSRHWGPLPEEAGLRRFLNERVNECICTTGNGEIVPTGKLPPLPQAGPGVHQLLRTCPVLWNLSASVF